MRWEMKGTTNKGKVARERSRLWMLRVNFTPYLPTEYSALRTPDVISIIFSWHWFSQEQRGWDPTEEGIAYYRFHKIFYASKMDWPYYRTSSSTSVPIASTSLSAGPKTTYYTYMDITQLGSSKAFPLPPLLRNRHSLHRARAHYWDWTGRDGKGPAV